MTRPHPWRTGLLHAALLGAVLLLAAPVAEAMFAPVVKAPVDRLVRNIELYVKAHPDDANGYYTLARVHYLALVLKAEEVGASINFGENGAALPWLAPKWRQEGARDPSDSEKRTMGPPVTTTGPAPPPGTEELLKHHVAAALENFDKAIKLDQHKNGLYLLGLASLMEQAGAVAYLFPDRLPPATTQPSGPGTLPQDDKLLEALVKNLGAPEFQVRETAQKALILQMPHAAPVLRRHLNDSDLEIRTRVQGVFAAYWKQCAIPFYLEAHNLAIGEDAKIREQPISGLNSLVSFEAGERYLDLVGDRGIQPGETATVAKIETALKNLMSKPPGGITPIILSLDRTRPLNELLEAGPEAGGAGGAGVKFDLDGTGRGFEWPWVKPDTAILVWNPEGTGKITSGHQLFGSVTFHMFWPTGYAALDALDDNRDGRLAGAELAGLALWRDRNGNGVCDRGEVTPIEQTPIASLSTQPEGKLDGLHPFNATGLRLRDGRVLPTYDWTVQPKPTSAFTR